MVQTPAIILTLALLGFALPKRGLHQAPAVDVVSSHHNLPISNIVHPQEAQLDGWGNSNDYATVCETRAMTTLCQQSDWGYYCDSKGKLAKNGKNKDFDWEYCKTNCECINLNPRPKCLLGISGQVYRARDGFEAIVTPEETESHSIAVREDSEVTTYGMTNDYAMVCDSSSDWTELCASSEQQYHCDKTGKLQKKGTTGWKFCKNNCECMNLNPEPQCLLGISGALYCRRDEHDLISARDESAVNTWGTGNDYASICDGKTATTQYCQSYDYQYYCDKQGKLQKKGAYEATTCIDKCECSNFNRRPKCLFGIDGQVYCARIAPIHEREESRLNTQGIRNDYALVWEPKPSENDIAPYEPDSQWVASTKKALPQMSRPNNGIEVPVSADISRSDKALDARDTDLKEGTEGWITVSSSAEIHGQGDSQASDENVA